MRRVNAYRSAERLVDSLDNGGRWYHLWSKASDGRVSAGELSKAAGSYDPRTAVCFVALAWWELPDGVRAGVRQKLDPEVKKMFDTWPPAIVAPSGLGGLVVGTPAVAEGALFPARMPAVRPGGMTTDAPSPLAALAQHVSGSTPRRDVFELRGEGTCLMSTPQGRCKIKVGAAIRASGIVSGDESGRRWLEGNLYSLAD